MDSGQELRLDGPSDVSFEVLAAARLEGSPEIEVELVVNGYPRQTRKIVADGTTRPLKFTTRFERSGWAALRVFPHAHGNPVHVIVKGEPVRASADSARWCLEGVERCWNSKRGTYAEAELEAAREAYEHARRAYRRILRECGER